MIQFFSMIYYDDTSMYQNKKVLKYSHLQFLHMGCHTENFSVVREQVF